MPFYSVTTLLSVYLLATSSAYGNSTKATTLHILKAMSAPIIDGALDDPVWQETPFFSNFIQQSPTAFATPGEKTEIAVAYNAQYLFVAVKCHSSKDNTIVSRLVRRDRDGDFDKISLIISPMNDGKTGYGFTVNPDGMKQDGTWSDDSAYDSNWDAVWDVASTQENHLWTAEFAIPWDQMRFRDSLSSIGFQVKRWIATRHEMVVLNPKPRGAVGEVSQSGKLTGLNQLSPKLPFSMQPEVVVSWLGKDSGSDRTSPEGADIGVGGYIKAGVAPGWTLDFAITPDFGEVEMDSAQINLTNIETAYAEKRPFFLENRQMFETPVQLFYSRRLGAPPPTPDVADNETIREVPLNTPILVATKFSGMGSKGGFLGLIHVLSSPVRVRVRNDDTGVRRWQDATVYTHDNILRVGKQLKNGSDVGLMATAHVPENRMHQAYAGSMDWNLYWKDREYGFNGQVIGSAVQADTTSDLLAPKMMHKHLDFDEGLGVYTKVGRQGGDFFRTSIAYEYRSDKFDVNALGYLDRNDIHKLTPSFQFLFPDKQRFIYELYTGGELYLNWNTDGLSTSRSIMLFLNIKWRNRMWLYMGTIGKLAHYDDLEFADGPPLKRIPGIGGWISLVSPMEKRVGGSVEYNMGTDDTGYYFIFKPSFQLRTNRIEFELSYRLIRATNRESYADTVSPLDFDQFIVSKRNLLESNIGLKTTIVLAQNLTAELNTQLLASKAHYHDFRELHWDSSEHPANFYKGNPDFGKTVWNLQALLRYEFRPQSILYFVYSRQSDGELENGPYTVQRTYRTTDQYTEQRFLIKASYLF